ncbi:ATP-binding cassette domain-containing protein [Spirosoma agri]|uniref:ATP-binding cassette domain-containing protein n=1 Tax=Spirosoma agri TaxID=1987381 RepID=A0A6M0ILT5_9BACT|nr:ATP-binding cassette domain-containing protein [Spirosoma agri]NEU68837.1 ATP-binding cassette domain-containing protein [Spirosoma agri]
MPSQLDSISTQHLSVRRGGQLVLADVSVTIKSGECWALVGPTGSGKTTFLQALAGQLPTTPGTLTRNQSVAFVSFKEASSQFSYSGHFYQQRYHSTLSDSHEGKPALTVREYLRFSGSAEDTTLVQRLGLEPFLDSAFIKLSNGQTRKARIGRALLQHPELLLLDDPFVGLDAAFRQELSQWLGNLTHQGLTVIIATEITKMPAFITHVLVLEKGRLVEAGPKETIDWKEKITKNTSIPQLQTLPKPADFEEAFRLTDVTVQYGERVILNAINWVVKANERWGLMGRNGAGKSVLLSLLYGDHPQAYANDVRVFGHRRGRGESIWDVKRRIGFVSPELHLYFPQSLSVRQVAFTGLTDTLTVPAHVPASAEADFHSLLDYFGITNLVDRTFGTLSVGEQRLVLLIRALLKNPSVLILDEPFQAIDDRRIQLARRLLDSFTDKTILFVTHDRTEFPASVDQIFELL